MAPGAGAGPVGGPSSIVEADETEISPSRKSKVPADGRKRENNKRFVALVERDGKVRFAVIDGRTMSGVHAAVRANVHPESILHTDGAQDYKGYP
jgi:hypothetical protein